MRRLWRFWLLSPRMGGMHTVRLKGMGTFRVTARVVEGKTVLVGIPMDSIDDVVLMLVGVEIGLSLVVAIAAGFAGRAWVRRELRPLSVVRAAAADIASRDLADESGNLTRVGEETTAGPAGGRGRRGCPQLDDRRRRGRYGTPRPQRGEAPSVRRRRLA